MDIFETRIKSQTMHKKLFFFIPFLFFTLFGISQIPSTYYKSIENKRGTELQQALHEIIDNHNRLTYSEVWSAFYTTDRKLNGDIWDIYSDVPGGTPAYTYDYNSDQCGNYSGESSCYNREHSFPKSWFNDQSPMYTDLFHLYPTDGYVNGKRGNYPLGEVGIASWTSTNGSKVGSCDYPGYSGTVFEPIDEYKGDLARTYFYMATRYFNEDSNWPGSPMVDGAQPKEWAMNMLLEWSAEDPVSQKEIDRNNEIFELQGNRNPFIDHPEYILYVWGNEALEPSNHVSNFTGNFIKLEWKDATGEVIPDGYLVLMNDEGFDQIPTPKKGTLPNSYPNSKDVEIGIQHCIFGNLERNRDYYFKIYSYTKTINGLVYKTDGQIPRIKKTL